MSRAKTHKNFHVASPQQSSWSPIKDVHLLHSASKGSNFAVWKKELQSFLHREQDFGSIIEHECHKTFVKPSINMASAPLVYEEEQEDAWQQEDEDAEYVPAHGFSAAVETEPAAGISSSQGDIPKAAASSQQSEGDVPKRMKSHKKLEHEARIKAYELDYKEYREDLKMYRRKYSSVWETIWSTLSVEMQDIVQEHARYSAYSPAFSSVSPKDLCSERYPY